VRTLKQFVNDSGLYSDFLEALDSKISLLQSSLEQSLDPPAIYRLQGKIMALRQLKSLREEVNAVR